MNREAPPPENQRCQTCAWWERALKGDIRGDCRKGLPRPGMEPWPVTLSTDWCGQWAATRGWLPLPPSECYSDKEKGPASGGA